MKKIVQSKLYDENIPLLTCAQGAQKCAVFEKQWEADCAPASHIFIDNQRTKYEMGKRKKMPKMRNQLFEAAQSGKV
jgi:hypothetical protein